MKPPSRMPTAFASENAGFNYQPIGRVRLSA